MTSCLALMTFWLTAHGEVPPCTQMRNCQLFMAKRTQASLIVGAGLVDARGHSYCQSSKHILCHVGCTVRRYYVRGENSPAVPLAFMAAHTICSVGAQRHPSMLQLGIFSTGLFAGKSW